MGVQLFFILSGYLVFCSIERSENFSYYIKKRIMKIIPSYYMILIILYIKDLIFYSSSQSFISALSGPCSFKYLRYFLFLHMFIPSDNWDLWNNRSALWTLSSFAFFYIIAPVLFKLLNGFWKSLIVLGLFLIITPYISGELMVLFNNYPASGHIDWFVSMNPIGTLRYFLFGTTLYWGLKERKEIYYGVILFLLLIMSQKGWYSYEMLFALFIMLMILSNPITVNLKLKNVITYFSNGSFILYLFHYMILQITNYFINILGLSNYYGVKFILLFGVAIVGSYSFYSLIMKRIDEYIAKKIWG